MTNEQLDKLADNLIHIAKYVARKMQVMLIEKRITRLEKQAGIRKSIVGQDSNGDNPADDKWPSIQLQL